MVRFCANVSMLFAEAPFLERFGRAREAGFEAVEFQFPYDFAPDAIRAELDRHELELVLFNMPAGDFGAGDRGLANDPARVDDFRATLKTAMNYAAVLKPAKMNCMAGKLLADVPEDQQRATLIANLRDAADQAAAKSILLVTEPLNRRSWSAGYRTVERINSTVCIYTNQPRRIAKYQTIQTGNTIPCSQFQL